jgi:hypothetical protein
LLAPRGLLAALRGTAFWKRILGIFEIKGMGVTIILLISKIDKILFLSDHSVRAMEPYPGALNRRSEHPVR